MYEQINENKDCQEQELGKFVFEIPTGKQPTFEMFCCIGTEQQFALYSTRGSCWPSGILATIPCKYYLQHLHFFCFFCFWATVVRVGAGYIHR